MVSHFSIFYSTLFEIIIENFDSNHEANYRKDPLLWSIDVQWKRDFCCSDSTFHSEDRIRGRVMVYFKMKILKFWLFGLNYWRSLKFDLQ